MNGIETLRSVDLFRDLDDATLTELASHVPTIAGWPAVT